MCDTCASMQDKISRAMAERRPEKIRVMAVIYLNHCKISHPGTCVVAVAPDFIAWQNGARWKVVE